MNQTPKRELRRATAPEPVPLWVRQLRQVIGWAAVSHEALIEVPTRLTKDRLVRFLARELHEKDRHAVARLAGVVRRIGFVPACNVLIRTIQIQSTGGLDRDDGKGKRTAGGVFFYLTRSLWAGKHWPNKVWMRQIGDAKRRPRQRFHSFRLFEMNGKSWGMG